MANWIDIKDEQPKVGSSICVKWGDAEMKVFANCYVSSLFMNGKELNLRTRVGNQEFHMVNFQWQPYTEGMSITDVRWMGRKEVDKLRKCKFFDGCPNRDILKGTVIEEKPLKVVVDEDSDFEQFTFDGF